MIPVIGFAEPLLLSALILLPVIWWLLRFTPPRPVRIAFPPTRILLDLEQPEETPARSPWWLTLLRIIIATLAILALARPILNPPAITATGKGPLLVVIDNGWGAAPAWPRMLRTARAVVGDAGSAGRPVILIEAAEGESALAVAPDTADAALDRLGGMSPRPWGPRRADLMETVREAVASHGADELVWLSDGLAHGAGEAFAPSLATLEISVSFIGPDAQELPLALGPPEAGTDGLTVEVLGAGGDLPEITVQALDRKGRLIASAPAGGETENGADAVFDLPVELRNEIARLDIANARTAGSVQLLDDRWRRRTIGLVSGESVEQAQPLLSPLHYITRALAPHAELRLAPEPIAADALQRFFEQRVSAIIMADIGTVAGDTREELEKWVSKGGVLVRFAGPRLAVAEDPLVPARLRRGERILGGALSWAEPQPLAAFGQDTPFAGLEVPSDVIVSRQVLAEPTAELAERIWATLGDGTPLVTGTRYGNGWLILFHVTAETAWSNLPLIGTFVEMLRRIVDLSSAAGAVRDGAEASSQTVALRPLRALDAFGRLVPPAATSEPLEASAIAATRPGPVHPPGLYGDDESFRALNLIGKDSVHAALALPDTIPSAIYPVDDPRSLLPWLLTAAMVLLLTDGIIMLFRSGRGLRIPSFSRDAGALVALIAVFALTLPPAAFAQSKADTDFALQATTDTRLAFVVTGDAEIDSISEAGLAGLSQTLLRRTALEPGPPLGIDLETSELAFFPIIYWPIDPQAPVPSAKVLARLDAYMKNGGTVLIDTRDEIQSVPGADGATTGPGMQRLRVILRGTDIPELETVPADHVLTKTFYLLQNFPGRWDGSPLWVEASIRDPDAAPRPARNADGVSSIIITANDLAGAWAVDATGAPLLPVVPGGEWQRELAFRAGVNIVMYSMTGNYKADQVHIPALLERLGQ